jgi:large subunit ribosomal protein L29
MAEGKSTTTAKELRERNDSELHSLLAQKNDELFKARFKHTLGQLRETHVINAARRDIARINSILAERSKKS